MKWNVAEDVVKDVRLREIVDLCSSPHSQSGRKSSSLEAAEELARRDESFDADRSPARARDEPAVYIRESGHMLRVEADVLQAAQEDFARRRFQRFHATLVKQTPDIVRLGAVRVVVLLDNSGQFIQVVRGCDGGVVHGSRRVGWKTKKARGIIHGPRRSSAV